MLARIRVPTRAPRGHFRSSLQTALSRPSDRQPKLPFLQPEVWFTAHNGPTGGTPFRLLGATKLKYLEFRLMSAVGR